MVQQEAIVECRDSTFCRLTFFVESVCEKHKKSHTTYKFNTHNLPTDINNAFQARVQKCSNLASSSCQRSSFSTDTPFYMCKIAGCCNMYVVLFALNWDAMCQNLDNCSQHLSFVLAFSLGNFAEDLFICLAWCQSVV